LNSCLFNFSTCRYLAEAEDVIVVTLNFRLNIFGFPGAPSYTQNLGLLDQRSAIEWVRDNIVAFGGSPSKIVVVGQSSGAVAVDMWAYSHGTDPIVSGLISHSGNVFSFPINTPSLAAEHWYNVSTQLGCGSSGDVMACMRSKAFTDIRTAAASVRPPPSDSVARSVPVFQVTVDNVTVFGDYKALSDSGSFAPIPYLHGNTDYESGYYKITAYGSTNTTAPESVWKEFQLDSFTCPTAVQASNRVRFGVPTFRYRYFGDWDNLRLYPGSGAYHGSDINMIVGNSDAVSGLPSNEKERQLTRLVMRAWAAFADDPANGLIKRLGWPRYAPEGKYLP
jgi:cholinesterase